MGVRGGVRGAAGLGRWLSARGWCAVVVMGAMPLVTAAHAPVAVRYRVTRTIPVGLAPDAVAVDSAARTVYVTSADDGTVWVIDAATGMVTHTIPVGSGPFGVAVDPAARTVYVTNEASATVSVIDAATSTVTASLTRCR